MWLKKKSMGEEPKCPSVGTGFYVGFRRNVGRSTACPGESSGEFVGAWAFWRFANIVVG